MFCCYHQAEQLSDHDATSPILECDVMCSCVPNRVRQQFYTKIVLSFHVCVPVVTHQPIALPHVVPRRLVCRATEATCSICLLCFRCSPMPTHCGKLPNRRVSTGIDCLCCVIMAHITLSLGHGQCRETSK